MPQAVSKKMLFPPDEIALLLDRDLKALEASPKYLRYFGLKENPVGKPLSTFHPEGMSWLLQQACEDCLANCQRQIFEDFCAQHNSWFEYRVTPVEQGLYILILDITVRQQTQARIHAQEQRYRSMLEGSASAVCQIALDGSWLHANSRGLDILGFTAETLKSKTLQEVMVSPSPESDSDLLVKLVEGSIDKIALERLMTCQNESKIWVHLTLSLVRSAQGRPCFFVMVFDDIAERKEAEESLQFALEAARMGEWDYDALSNCTRRSGSFSHIYGYSLAPEEWTFEDFITHTHPEDRKLLEQEFGQALAHGKNFMIDVRALWPDNSAHWVSLRGRVYVDRSGRAIRMAGLVLDISREKQAETELQNAKLSAEDANREKSYFLANMSHEIRTPLGAIMGFTQALNDPNLDHDERSKYLEILLRNGTTLSRLIDDILDLSKVEAGFLEVERRPVFVPQLMEDLAALLKVTADAKGIELKVCSKGVIPTTILTDSIRLRQILLNVIGNAIKFTAVGRVEVLVELEEAQLDSKFLTFTVSDTGPGIAPGQARRLFQPFTQADSTTSRKHGGTGLGLALSRRIARTMGGDLVLFASTPGQGSKFRVTLPVVLPSPKELGRGKMESVSERVVKTCGSIDGLRVLLADDSPDNQELIVHLLAKRGATTEVADDGAQAVEKARGSSFDLILMDMQMPKLDGYQATAELRRTGFDRPIIALTANAMRHDRDKCLKAGCSDYVAKPIDPETLYRIMGNVMVGSEH